MFDFFDKKKNERIDSLENEVSRLLKLLDRQKLDYESLESNFAKYKHIVDVEAQCQNIINNMESKVKDLEEKLSFLNNNIGRNENILTDLEVQISSKKEELIELDDNVLLQDFGLYKPVYTFETSEEYKSQLQNIQIKLKELVTNGQAALCSQDWRINGSEAKGQTFIKKNIGLIIRCFNSECSSLINKVRFNNAEAYIEKIFKTYNTLNKLNEPNCIKISQSYLNLKIEELRLTHEYHLKKQKEKDEQRDLREQMREEMKLMQEIEEKRKEIIKELSHYNKQLVQVNTLIIKAPKDEVDYLQERKTFITDRLEELDREIQEMDYREANKKAGYVYIISNIGSFGENVFKIGMTRRLEPMDRIDELSSASVPFRFDVHALIFSENAPALEAALHRAFEKNRVNLVNGRKEFFKVSLEEIESVVKNNYEKAVDFIKLPLAEQYRETMKLKI